MNKKQELGRMGENLAAIYLEKQGYEILDRNWRFQHAEIDIIARNENTLIFIEVKSRSDDYFGEPEDAVSPRKMTLIADAATRYMELMDHEWAVRFDVISLIIKSEEVYTLDHHKDSFFPY